MTDFAVRWLRDHGEGRFFLWVHYFDPHGLYSPSVESIRAFYAGDPRAGGGPPIRDLPEFLAGPQHREIRRWLGETRDLAWPRALYAAVLHEADAAFGRLLAALPAPDSTAVVVTADHGESLGEHGVFYAHEGLYEAQLRVPLLVHVPGAAPVRSELPVSTIDVTPTVVELFGIEVRNQQAGLSLVSAVRGAPTRELLRRTTFLHQHANNLGVAVRDGDWKLVWYRAPIPPLAAGVSLYRLSQDPGELRNLADKEPERLRTMQQQAEAWISMHPRERADAQDLDPQAQEQLRALGYAEP